MSSIPYDTDALTRFVEQADLFGLKRLPAPPATLREADQVRREPNAPAQWLAAIVVFIGGSLVGSLGVGLYLWLGKGISDTDKLVKEIQDFSFGRDNDQLKLIIMLGLYALAAYLLYLLFVRFIASRPVYELFGEGSFKEFVAGLAVGTALILVIIIALYTMGHYHVDGFEFGPGVITGLFIGIGPAFSEEVVFRGFVLRLLDKSIGAIPAILVTSIVFGLIHAGNEHVTLVQSLLLGISAGLLLGSAYFLTRRLWLAIGIHLSWNFVQGGIFNSDVSGTGYNSGLFRATFSGPDYLTGGAMGIEGSVLSIGLTIAVSLIMLGMAYKRGHITGRVGWNAPRINLLGSVPRIEIWSADGEWRPLPTPLELNAMMAPEDEPETIQTGIDGHSDASEATAAPVPTGAATPPEDDIQELPIPPDDELLSGDLADIEAAHAATPDDKTEQFEPISSPVDATLPASQPTESEMESLMAQAPTDEPPTITKVSSSVTAVTGTGTGHVTDEDLDSTQQMEAVTELDMTDQIKPIEQTKVEPDADE
ncbi:CPBP family intramembrane glutamic endopeptidase [Stomatohabitans albus]|uniref:CPBP family intramembrane glutamic endopeptidase n=1 Tax=Stomatohabitans albus TaxID=3110766 RepID=UPI00300D553A